MHLFMYKLIKPSEILCREGLSVSQNDSLESAFHHSCFSKFCWITHGVRLTSCDSSLPSFIHDAWPLIDSLDSKFTYKASFEFLKFRFCRHSNSSPASTQ